MLSKAGTWEFRYKQTWFSNVSVLVGFFFLLWSVKVPYFTKTVI